MILPSAVEKFKVGKNFLINSEYCRRMGAVKQKAFENIYWLIDGSKPTPSNQLGSTLEKNKIGTLIRVSSICSIALIKRTSTIIIGDEMIEDLLFTGLRI